MITKEAAWALFHKLWDTCRESHEYNVRDWIEFERIAWYALQMLDESKSQQMIGKIVCMTDTLKKDQIVNGCEKHVEKFGNCFGIVVSVSGPEVNVKWEEDEENELTYKYLPEHLKVCG